MVSYLNIPLSRNTKTTRHHSRRVVWFFLLSCAAGILLSWRIVDVFLTRDTVLRAAPEETVAIIRFHPSKKTWPDLITLLGNTPLISNRPITIKDIQPFVKGELAVFFNKQGGKSLAIKTSQEDLPKDTFDKLGISIQKVNSDLFLLSETLMPVGGEKEKTKKQSSFFSRGVLGSLSLKTEENTWISGPITQNNGLIRITLPNPGIDEVKEVTIPETVIVALSIQGLTLLDPEIISSSLNNFIGLGSGFFNILNDGAKNPVKILLSKKDIGSGFQYLLSTETSKNKEEMIRFLKQIVATNEPTVALWSLEDGSLAYEMIADSSNINYEEINISGVPVVRFSLKNGEEIHFLQEGNSIFLSNSSKLLGEYLSQGSEKKIGVFYLNMREVLPFLRKQESMTSEIISTDLLNNISIFEIKMSEKSIVFNINQ